MASLTKKKPNGKVKSNGSAVEIPVEFGNLNVGDETAKLSLKISKDRLNIVAAEELLCGRRLHGCVQIGGYDDSNGQSTFFKDVEVEGTFDIHRFGVGPKAYSTGLTFKKSEVDMGDLVQFGKAKGRFRVFKNEPIPHDVAEEDEAETNQTLPGTFKSDLPWRKVSLDTLFSGGILKAFKGAGLSTVGDYHDYQQPDKNGYTKTTRDIKGLGEAKAQQAEDRMLEFWRDNPQD